MRLASRYCDNSTLAKMPVCSKRRVVRYLWHGPDDLDSHFFPRTDIKCFHNLAKRALAE